VRRDLIASLRTGEIGLGPFGVVLIEDDGDRGGMVLVSHSGASPLREHGAS
jgi:hypothetical protein